MSAPNVRIRWQGTSHRRILVVAGYAVAFLVFGFFVEAPGAIGSGLGRILFARDTLITDYIGLGGMGAAFVNAGILALIACFLYIACDAKVTGTSVAALFLVLGFGLFGKNILNVWFLFLGVLIYVRFKRQNLAPHLDTAMFGLALAPVFSEVVFSTWLPFGVSVPVSIVVSAVLGFILIPVAGQAFNAHMGFNLYNLGFAAGLLALLVVSTFRSFGFVPEPVFIWTSGNNGVLGVFLACVFVLTILIGFLSDRGAARGMWRILTMSGRSPSDFFGHVGDGATLVNMGICGLIGLAYVLLVGAPINGPVIAALFTLVGFAACGKHPRNIVPVLAGVFLASLTKSMGVTEPSVVLAALFGTSLAPICGYFGWPWGVVAGAVHVSVVQVVGELHAGLNLYNNGLAAGFVACVIAPVAVAVRNRTRGESDSQALRP